MHQRGPTFNFGFPPTVLSPLIFVSVYSNFIHSDSSREDEGGLGAQQFFLVTLSALPTYFHTNKKRHLKDFEVISHSLQQRPSNWAWPWMWPCHLVSISAASADWKAKKSMEIRFLPIYLCSVIPCFTWPSKGMVICRWIHCGRAPLLCIQRAGMCSTRSGLNGMALDGGGSVELGVGVGGLS